MPLATRALQDKGVKGIKYKDGFSRGSEGGTNNYVIFNDKIISIAKKYGITAPMASAVLAGTMTPEQAQAAIAQQEQNQERRRRGEAFAMKREARKQQFAEVMQQLGNVLDLFDVPMQGLSGLARLGYGLAVGEDDALEQAARVTQQPIEDTAYQAGDYVLDKTGSPAAATAVNVLTQFAGPI